MPTITRASKAIAAKLEAAHQLITNTLKDGATASIVEGFGYDAAELQRGLGLYQAALTAFTAQDQAQGDKRQSVVAAAAAQQLLYRSCCALAELARTQFPAGSPERLALGLTRRTPRSSARLIAFAATLYTTAQTNPDIAAHLATRQYPAARLTAEAAHIAITQETGADQVRATAYAVHATRTQSTALAALSTWASAYRAVARHALRDAPHLRQSLAV